jgi:hypothetical protein
MREIPLPLSPNTRIPEEMDSSSESDFEVEMKTSPSSPTTVEVITISDSEESDMEDSSDDTSDESSSNDSTTNDLISTESIQTENTGLPQTVSSENVVALLQVLQSMCSFNRIPVEMLIGYLSSTTITLIIDELKAKNLPFVSNILPDRIAELHSSLTNNLNILEQLREVQEPNTQF